MKKFLLLFTLSALLFSCNKDDDDDNNNPTPSGTQYFLEYTNSAGDVVNIEGSTTFDGNPDYIIASALTSYADNGDSVFTFTGSFAVFNGSGFPYAISFDRMYESGFAGNSQEAGDKFIVPGAYTYSDNQLARNSVSIRWGDNFESTVHGDQSNSNFTITSVTFTGDANDPSWDVEGTFNCIIYDTNGNQVEEFSDGSFRIELTD